ncbi:MAG: hypothetical protein HQM16_13240 [Deltaproteobacteria bacterium]|nr:hypothetical protein [Deltaproteobacteria bacterium]
MKDHTVPPETTHVTASILEFYGFLTNSVDVLIGNPDAEPVSIELGAVLAKPIIQGDTVEGGLLTYLRTIMEFCDSVIENISPYCYAARRIPIAMCADNIISCNLSPTAEYAVPGPFTEPWPSNHADACAACFFTKSKCNVTCYGGLDYRNIEEVMANDTVMQAFIQNLMDSGMICPATEGTTCGTR